MGSTEKNVGKGMITCALGKSLWLQWVGQLENRGQKKGKKQRGKIKEGRRQVMRLSQQFNREARKWKWLREEKESNLREKWRVKWKDLVTNRRLEGSEERTRCSYNPAAPLTEIRGQRRNSGFRGKRMSSDWECWAQGRGLCLEKKWICSYKARK